METSDRAGFLIRMSASVLDHFPTYFARRRGLLGPRGVFVSVMAMSVLGSQSYRRVLDELRRVLGAKLGWDHAPSAGALALARRKLSGEQCRAGFFAIRDQCGRARQCPRETFRGLRLVAVDGTRLSLPISKALVKEFGCPTNQAAEPSACPQAGLVVLWDVGANQPIAWKLGEYRMAEREAATELLGHLGKGDLLLADRGYPGVEFFRAVRTRGTDFIIRMNTTSVAKTKEFSDFLASGEHDRVVDFPAEPTRDATSAKPATLRVRFIADPADPQRVVATSLIDQNTYPHAEILATYCSRWNIETALREGKQWHGLENFHARFPDGIQQEVAGIMTFLYLVAELEVDLREKVIARIATGDEPPDAATNIPYTFNRLLISDMSINLLMLAATHPDQIEREWSICVDTLWRGRARKRPGRSYQRIAKSPRSISQATRKRAKRR